MASRLALAPLPRIIQFPLLVICLSLLLLVLLLLLTLLFFVMFPPLSHPTSAQPQRMQSPQAGHSLPTDDSSFTRIDRKRDDTQT